MVKYTDVGKELIKNKTIANLSHYCNGNLYYRVQLESGVYQFPIETVETAVINFDVYFKEKGLDNVEGVTTLKLSSDLGTTPFNSEMKASELNRWIRKAIDKEEFIKVG